MFGIVKFWYLEGIIMRKMILAFITTVFLCGWGVNASVVSEQDAFKDVIVKEDDTLWEIASREIDNHKDVRIYIYQIKQINQITDSGNLVPGQVLHIPVNK